MDDRLESGFGGRADEKIQTAREAPPLLGRKKSYPQHLTIPRPHTGQSIGLLTPYMNADIMNMYLQQFSRELAADVHAVLIWDQAGFHKSRGLKIPDNVTIIPLPAYSPELNPVENLWHYFRSHYWSNRCYVDYDDLRHAAIEAWQKAALDPEIIKSVCRAEYTERKC
jgi:transposase